jgi:UDP-N-acetylglucosamine 2-epimerase (non-hydrolysing)
VKNFSAKKELMHITLIAGARPNFIKIAPIIRAIKVASGIEYRLVHTGQHYDDRLSKVFFEQLEIPDPHVNLGAGSGTQAEQTSRIMTEFENDLVAHPTDLVVVVGDVNSTMACTIVAKKLNVKVAHVEGGIRSFDMSMPEEINRLVTDSIADYFFTTSQVANQNLRRNGISDSRIFFVGHTMIDTLLLRLPQARKPALWDKTQLRAGEFLVLTLHRPNNVDDLAKLSSLIEVVDAAGITTIFPVHPRTQKNFSQLSRKPVHVVPTDPMSYLEFIYLLKNAKAVVTDSGGVQEETTVLGVPCITLRKNTERPETVDIGTNELIGDTPAALRKSLDQLASGKWKKGGVPELWDGKTAGRIINCLVAMQKT